MNKKTINYIVAFCIVFGGISSKAHAGFITIQQAQELASNVLSGQSLTNTLSVITQLYDGKDGIDEKLVRKIIQIVREEPPQIFEQNIQQNPLQQHIDPQPINPIQIPLYRPAPCHPELKAQGLLTLPDITGHRDIKGIEGIYHIRSNGDNWLVPENWTCCYWPLLHACDLEKVLYKVGISSKVFRYTCQKVNRDGQVKAGINDPTVRELTFTQVDKIAQLLAFQQPFCFLYFNKNAQPIISNTLINAVRQQRDPTFLNKLKRQLYESNKRCIHFFCLIPLENESHCIGISLVKTNDGSTAMYIFDNRNEGTTMETQDAIRQCIRYLYYTFFNYGEQFVCQPPHTKNAQILDIQINRVKNIIFFRLSNDTYELWIKQPDEKFAFSQLLTPHTPNDQISEVELNPDGNAIALRLKNNDNTYTYELRTKKSDGQFTCQPPHTTNAQIRYIKFSSDGNAFALELSNGTCELWTKKQDGQFAYQPPHTTNARIWYIEFSPDGDTIALHLSNDTYELWTKKQDGQFDYSKLLTPHTPNAKISYINFSPDGNAIAVNLKFIDTQELWIKKENGQFAYQPPHIPNAKILSIKFSRPKGNAIALKLSNNTCEIWTRQQNEQFGYSQTITTQIPNAVIWHITLIPDSNATISLQLTNNTCEIWTKQHKTQLYTRKA